jgi:hypothetical protein
MSGVRGNSAACAPLLTGCVSRGAGLPLRANSLWRVGKAFAAMSVQAVAQKGSQVATDDVKYTLYGV